MFGSYSPSRFVCWSILLSACGLVTGLQVGYSNVSFHHQQHPDRLEQFRQSTLCLLFSKNGKKLFTGGGEHINPTYGRIICWDTVTHRPLHILDGHRRPVWCMALSPDEKTLASGGGDGDLRLWDCVNDKLLGELRGHDFDGTIDAIAFSADGKILASGCSGLNRCIMLWDVSTHKRLGVLKGFNHQVPIFGSAGDIKNIVFLEGSKFLAVADGTGKIKLWDVGTQKEILSQMEDELKGYCESLAVSVDGQFLAAGYCVPGPLDRPRSFFSGHLVVWDWKKQKKITQLKGHNDTVIAVTFFLNDKYLATASLDATARIFEVASGKEIRLFRANPLGEFPLVHALRGLAVSPDGKTLAVTCDYRQSGSIRLFDLSDLP
jgi:WD40 repeat protein